MSTLGCPETYRAVIHWRGGGQVFNVPELSGVTGITWERKLSETSAATVTIARAAMDTACCETLGQVEPWCHELSIYRDEELVWQGPIVETSETRDAITISAQDISAWLAKLVNRLSLKYAANVYDATWIAYDIIRRNLNDTLSVPHDYPVMLSYVRRQNCGSKPGFNKGAWVEYVSEIVTELAQYGFQWTTIGRSYYIRDIYTDTATAQARLTGADILGDVEVTRAGNSAATAAFATNQQEDPDTGQLVGQTVWRGTLGTPYGRLDTRVVFSDQNASTASLTAGALAALGGRYPAPLTVSVPDGSQLSPSAPVTVEQLVCGERFDLILPDFCRPVEQGFRLTAVTGSWTTGGEKIGVRMTPLTTTAEDA